MLILTLLLWGVFAGGIAWLILRGGPMREVRWSQAIVAGVVGSFLGGLAVNLIAGDGLKLRPSGLIGSVLGAIVVLWILGMFEHRRGARQQPRA